MIRQGGKLVESAQDVLEELAPYLSGEDRMLPAPVRVQHPSADQQCAADLDDDYQRLLSYMGFDTVSVDGLVERSGLTPEAVSSMLLILELRGFVASVAGGLYVRLSRET